MSSFECTSHVGVELTLCSSASVKKLGVAPGQMGAIEANFVGYSTAILSDMYPPLLQPRTCTRCGSILWFEARSSSTSAAIRGANPSPSFIHMLGDCGATT
ncbi:hypothetical protein TESS_TESS_02244 [Tessaracoccus sp. O5.2]